VVRVEESIHRAIENLLHEWARTVDEARYEDLTLLMTESGEYKVMSRFNVERGLPLAIIYARSQAQFRDRILSMRVANVYETQFYRHTVTGVQIISVANGRYEVRANYTVVRIMEHDGSMTLFSTGQYRDEVVFEGETPKFARRHVVYDSRAIDTLLVIPL
jgi:anthranilate 1,2-dioxygenase small subunit